MPTTFGAAAATPENDVFLHVCATSQSDVAADGRAGLPTDGEHAGDRRLRTTDQDLRRVAQLWHIVNVTSMINDVYITYVTLME
jgi:hypothetical protein